MIFLVPGITQNCIIIEEGNSSIDERRSRQKQYLLKGEAKEDLYDERAHKSVNYFEFLKNTKNSGLEINFNLFSTLNYL